MSLIPGLSDWQARVVDEQRELSAKIQRLSAFLHTEDFMRLAREDQKLLTEQAGHMINYSHCLLGRIERFKYEGPKS